MKRIENGELRRLLGVMMTEEGAVERLRPIIDEHLPRMTDFECAVYTAIRGLHDMGEPVDLITVAAAIKMAGMDDGVCLHLVEFVLD